MTSFLSCVAFPSLISTTLFAFPYLYLLPPFPLSLPLFPLSIIYYLPLDPPKRTPSFRCSLSISFLPLPLPLSTHTLPSPVPSPSHTPSRSLGPGVHESFTRAPRIGVVGKSTFDWRPDPATPSRPPHRSSFEPRSERSVRNITDKAFPMHRRKV